MDGLSELESFVARGDLPQELRIAHVLEQIAIGRSRRYAQLLQVLARDEQRVLISADADFGADVSDLFNFLTGFSRQSRYRKLLVAPVSLRKALVEMIRERDAGAGADDQLIARRLGLAARGAAQNEHRGRTALSQAAGQRCRRRLLRRRRLRLARPRHEGCRARDADSGRQ